MLRKISFLKNFKLRQKFILVFGLILILVLTLGISGISSLRFANKSYQNFTKAESVVVSEAINIVDKVIQLRVDAFQIALKIKNYTKPEQYEEVYNILKNTSTEIENVLQIYIDDISKNISDPKEKESRKALVGRVLELSRQYYQGMVRYIDEHKAGNLALAQQIDDSLTPVGNELFTSIYSVPIESFDYLVKNMNVIGDQVNIRVYELILLFIIIVVVGTISGTALSLSIRKPIEYITAIAKDVVEGDLEKTSRIDGKDEISTLSNAIADMSDIFREIILDISKLSKELEEGNLQYRIDSNQYKGSFKETIDGINKSTSGLVGDTNYIIGIINEIGNGNFESNIKDLPGEKAKSVNSLKQVQNSVKSVVNEINEIIKAANEGDLEYRINSENYRGQWKNIMNALNLFTDNVGDPIKETQVAIYEFSRGNFSHRITKDYKGQFDKIKKTVNYTAETVGSYINEISEILNKMANKDFNVGIFREYLGDFKAIQESANRIVTNLNILTKGIISSAEQVSSGVKQISESSISLAEGATEQAEAVEKLNFVIKKISQETIENANNANRANELALETKDNAAKGSKQMDNMLVAMQDINDASNSISNIIKVIDDIAFQTNILALNAAVEAARAGEHGKGFAVVAEEVRSLAARSQEAAKETTLLIRSSVEKVTEGSKIANNTADALLTIVKQIESISGLVDACAISSKSQESAIEEVIGSIGRISTVTQNNTATSEESAAASEELASQAEVFYSSVSDFKLKDDLMITEDKEEIKEDEIKLDIYKDDNFINLHKEINLGEESDFGKY